MNNLVIEVPVPGFPPETVEVTAESRLYGYALVVRAKNKAGREYESSWTVNKVYDVQQASAVVEHGLLTISVPLYASEQPKKIPVQIAQPAQLQS